MPPRGENPDLIRIVEGLRGKVSMQMELIIRFDYGHIVPWVRRRKRFDGLEAIAGPDGLILRTSVETQGKDLTTTAEFTVGKGDRIPFVLTWFASHTHPPRKINPEHALRDTEVFWTDWAKRFQTKGKWREAIVRSLITLKGLTYAPTGGLVAALTTSLPEQIGGVRNWDYRFCWLRDAALILLVLMRAGFRDEAMGRLSLARERGRVRVYLEKPNLWWFAHPLSRKQVKAPDEQRREDFTVGGRSDRGRCEPGRGGRAKTPILSRVFSLLERTAILRGARCPGAALA